MTSKEQKSKKTIQLDLDAFIQQLLSSKNKDIGQELDLKEQDILCLISISKDVFMSQPVLLELEAPLKVCGDIHGQYYDLLRVFDYGGYPPDSNYLFLGDYVDRGSLNLETICLLLCFKVKYPENFFLLRGNHESETINRIYGFYEECKRRFSVKLWKQFSELFKCLPVAALIEDRILCMHGGLSPDMHSIDQILSIQRPVKVPDNGLLCDILWSDPEPLVDGWGENERGVSYTFGKDILDSFMQAQDLDLICRAHQVVEDGYEFFHKRKLVTLFSAPNYCGEFDNSSAIMNINQDLICSFQILQPFEQLKKLSNQMILFEHLKKNQTFKYQRLQLCRNFILFLLFLIFDHNTFIFLSTFQTQFLIILVFRLQ